MSPQNKQEQLVASEHFFSLALKIKRGKKNTQAICNTLCTANENDKQRALRPLHIQNA